MKRIILIIVLICLVICICTACGKGEGEVKEALDGTWEYSWESLVGTCTITYEFRDDGWVSHDFLGATLDHSEGTYSIKDDTIICEWEDGTTANLMRSDPKVEAKEFDADNSTETFTFSWKGEALTIVDSYDRKFRKID